MTTYVVASKANTPYLAEVSFYLNLYNISAKSWATISKRTLQIAEFSLQSKTNQNGLNLSIQSADPMASTKRHVLWSTP